MIDTKALSNCHHLQQAQILAILETSRSGLSIEKAAERLQQFGTNELPQAKRKSIGFIVFSQFKSPLIYILLAAALLSLVVQEWIDAGFIIFVLCLNASIGAIQEYHAEKSAAALQKMVAHQVRVKRNNEISEIPATQLVPGDIVILESGDKVPADLRLLQADKLEVDQSLLTGESFSQLKQAEKIISVDTDLAGRNNMLFAGTLLIRGRAIAVVITTGLHTALGEIAKAVTLGKKEVPPLIQRMERFTKRIAIGFLAISVIIVLVATWHGQELFGVILVAIALAVAAIPEGLPVAITIALAVGMRHMATNNVIVRRLVAAETLGSCTYIASDKTGTLTVNELTVKKIWLPPNQLLEVHGQGINTQGEIHIPAQAPIETGDLLINLARTSIFCNEGSFYFDKHQIHHSGDAVDVALLVMAQKIGLVAKEVNQDFALIDQIAFEPERQFAATLHQLKHKQQISVKGAPEKILAMCSNMTSGHHTQAINPLQIENAAIKMAEQGYRVLAIAYHTGEFKQLNENDLNNFTFLGLVGMIDPPRQNARQAIQQCQAAGIRVAMLTGDHPITAVAIASDLGICDKNTQVVTGKQLRQLTESNSPQLKDAIIKASVFARVEPTQKLQIVIVLSETGEFVAVTGDGANDAPALRKAHVGVAMGVKGTDVARESADLVLTDDNFASLVEGIKQGRIAYSNVRKVIFLLISTGIAEVFFFLLAIATNSPMPFTTAQLLWLNLVTQGIQDVGLAFEPGEGDEMKKPPRSPKETIFNRLMIERCVISALSIGILAFAVFQFLLSQGYQLESARNLTLLLMVLFENVQVFNARSEHRSVFTIPIFSNPILMFGTLGAQLFHIAALYIPGLQIILDTQPVSFEQWFYLFGLALVLLVIMELHKWIQQFKTSK